MHECPCERGVIMNTVPCFLHAEEAISPCPRVGIAMGTPMGWSGERITVGKPSQSKGKKKVNQSKTKSRRKAPELSVVGMQRGKKAEESLGKKNRKIEGSRVVKW